MSKAGGAVFLDRDGTLNVRPPSHQYVTDASGFVWLPGAREALARLAARDWPLAVVSNQRGVARGLLDTQALRDIDRRMQRELRPLGVRIAVVRYCIHDLDADCRCRKPKPGMILESARELDVRPEDSWMVGDSDSDVEAGRRAGCATIRLDASSSAVCQLGPREWRAGSLQQAARIIVA